MSRTGRENVKSRWDFLIPRLRSERFRTAFFEKRLKAFLANQIRALRGDATQIEFAQTLGTTQSVVSRLEDEGYGKLNTQTLIDMAKKLNIYLVVKFVDFPTFVALTDDLSESALRPAEYDEKIFERIYRKWKAKLPVATADANPVTPPPQLTGASADDSGTQWTTELPS